jgi:hypothetical protein
MLGFTGTRQGMTPAQQIALADIFTRYQPNVLLHGGAIGADGQAHNIAHEYQYNDAPPYFGVYPADMESSERWRRVLAHTDGRKAGFVYPVLDPLVRNRIIARRCHRLIACPAEPDEQLRSGTWATVRYARGAGKPITIIAPDGSVRNEP